jgi:hypothetical protein
MRRLIILTAFVGLALVAPASAQTTPEPTGKQIEEARKRQENQTVLGITGAKMRKVGQTPAQKAAQAKADAEAAKRRKYRKNHKSAIVAKEHPAATKPESKPSVKAEPKQK